MKNPKKYISIIIPLLVLLFVSFGLFFSSKLIASAREDNELKYSVNEESDKTDTTSGGGTTGTVPEGSSSSDDGTNDDYTGDENTGDATTKTVSDSITVLVDDPDDPDDPDDDDEKPVCSQNTYQCEKGEAIHKKTTEGQNQFVYIWDCSTGTGSGQTKGCQDVMPTCGDFKYNDGNWTGGCDSGYTAEKQKDGDTYKWECRGTSGDPVKKCEYKPQNGQCKYIEDYYPTGGSYDPSKIFLCEQGSVEPSSRNADDENGIVSWTCLGEEGGADAFCKKTYYPYGVCGKEPLECWSGHLVSETVYRDDEGNVISWECIGPNETIPDGRKTKRSCTLDSENVDYVVGQCSEEKGKCIKGKETKMVEEEDGFSWECLGSGGGKTDYCFIEGPDEPPFNPPITPPKDPIDGICGSSNGLFFTKEPASDLCEQGELSGKVLKQENNSWSWICAGLHGGNSSNCQTGFASLTPKLSGCYIGQDQSSCQIEEPFNWLVSGIYNLLSLVTNKSEMALESGSGQKNLEIGYPFSDIKLKVDGGEVASSRAWAVCGNDLYWDSESGTCLKPKTCPGEPDYPEPETPYWTYEQTSECEILPGQEVGQLTITGTCQNYNQEEGMFCREADGTDYPRKIKDKTYSCFLNPLQPSTIDVTLNAKRLDGVDIDEENPSTERSFMVSWKAVVNPSHKFERCEEIEVREPGFSEVKYKIDIDNESSSGEKEQSHPGTPGKLELSLTCHDKNGNPATAKKTVYFDKITGSQIEY